jgi:hypothetical protein
LYHCIECHHEWEGTITQYTCDWCGQASHVLEAETPFEKFLREKGPEKIIKQLKEKKEKQ